MKGGQPTGLSGSRRRAHTALLLLLLLFYAGALAAPRSDSVTAHARLAILSMNPMPVFAAGLARMACTHAWRHALRAVRLPSISIVPSFHFILTVSQSFNAVPRIQARKGCNARLLLELAGVCSSKGLA